MNVTLDTIISNMNHIESLLNSTKGKDEWVYLYNLHNTLEQWYDIVKARGEA